CREGAGGAVPRRAVSSTRGRRNHAPDSEPGPELAADARAGRRPGTAALPAPRQSPAEAVRSDSPSENLRVTPVGSPGLETRVAPTDSLPRCPARTVTAVASAGGGRRTREGARRLFAGVLRRPHPATLAGVGRRPEGSESLRE